MEVTFSYFLTIRLQLPEQNLRWDSKTDIFIESETCCVVGMCCTPKTYRNWTSWTVTENFSNREKYKKILAVLENNAACIEYLDNEETDTCLIAMNKDEKTDNFFKTLIKRLKRFEPYTRDDILNLLGGFC